MTGSIGRFRFPRRARSGVLPAAVAALAIAALAAAAAPAQAQGEDPGATGFRPRPVREGTVSLYGGGQYGTLVGGGRFADVFNRGPGLGFELRYRTASDAALGFGFEAHYFDAKNPPDSAYAPDRLQLVLTTLDYYRFFNTRSRAPRYLVAGAGLMQSRQTDADGEREFPGDGGVVKLGGGVEYWLNRTMTAEFGLRYYGVLSRSELNHDVQVAAGINFYTSP